jgi:hypothetical protein
MPRKTDEELHPEGYFTTPEGHPRDRIIIHENSNIPKEGVFLGVNGFQMLAKPGIEIDIPRPVRQMLDTRIQTEIIQGDDGKDHVRNIPRFTYTLIKEGVNLPDAAVIASSSKGTPADQATGDDS